MIELPASNRERAVAGVLVGAAVLFVGFGIRRMSTGVSAAGFAGALTLPLVLLAADLVIAAALLTGWYPVRPVAQGLAVFGVLVHVLVVLRNGPVWVRGCSALLVVVHGWALVSLFLLTAAEDDWDDEDDEDDWDGDGGGDGGDGPVPDDVPRAAETTGVLLEVPISEVVELERPEQDRAAEPNPEPPVGRSTGSTPYDQEVRAR